MVYLIQDRNFLINIFSEKLASEMTYAGVPTQFISVGNKTCEKICRKLFLAKRLYNAICPYLNMQITKYQIKKKIKPGDVFIIYESANTISQFSDCGVHKLIRKLGGKVVSVVPDAWHLSFPFLQKGIEARASNSDLLAAVTPTLAEAFRERYPDKNVVLMEESIDYEAFSFQEKSSEYTPIVLWSGPPVKLDEVELLDKVLQKVGDEYKFKLRIVTGKDKPNLTLKTDWEWIPFVGTSYTEQFLGASIGFAFYENRAYSEFKGNYKIKTYLAAGCAIITNSTAYNRVLIDSEHNGVLVDSEEKLVEAFRTLLTNYVEREQKRKNSRNFIFENYSAKAIAQKYIQTLKQFNLI